MGLLHEQVTNAGTADLANTLDVLGQLLGNLAMQSRHGLGVRGSCAAAPLDRSRRQVRQRGRAQCQSTEPRPTSPAGFRYGAGRPLAATPALTRIAFATACAQFQPHDIRTIRDVQHRRRRNLVIPAFRPGVSLTDPGAVMSLWTRPETDVDRTLAIRVDVPPQMVRIDYRRPRCDRAGEQAGHVIWIDTAFHGGCHLCIVIKSALRAPEAMHKCQRPENLSIRKGLTEPRASGRPVGAGRGTP